MAHPWPGQRAGAAHDACRGRDPDPGRAHRRGRARPLLAEASPEPRRPRSPADERAWILDALRRNRFRRAETAAFLRLSRKTLYNKMRRYNLLD
jgi:DNA-binding NtrC family response regulator